MDEIAEIRQHMVVKRTPTKLISDAFNFLNMDDGYIEDEINGVPRISTSLSDSKLQSLRKRDTHSNHSFYDHNHSLPATISEGRIAGMNVTVSDTDILHSVERKPHQKLNQNVEPIQTRSASQGELRSSVSKATSNSEIPATVTPDDFTIVTYVEPADSSSKPTPQSQDVVIETEVVPLATEEVMMRQKSRNSSDRTVSISRVKTWQRNQDVVSEAFNFLKDIEGITDTTSMLSFQFPETEEELVIHGENRTSIPPDSPSISNTDNGLRGSKVSIEGDSVEKSNSVFLPEDDAVLKVSSEKIQNGETTIRTYQSSAGLPSSLENVILSAAANQIKLEQASEKSSESSETDDLGELQGTKLRNRRKNVTKPHNQDDDDGGSSDEDTGVYRESFRKSTWLFVGDSGDLSLSGQESSTTKESGFVSLSDLDIAEADSVFDLPPESPAPSPLKKMVSHKRSESTTTTASEKEFRNTYNSIRNRVVQRKDSLLEYKRMTEKFYDQQKTYILTKDSADSGYGIHLLHTRPAIISSVDKGTPAENVGVREGQILISINGVNVLDADHDEIVRLVQENSTSMTLEVGYSDVQCIRDLQLPVLTGYLMKQTSTAIFKSWKRRFFILRYDNCLYYYKNDQENDPLGAIQLSGYGISRHGDLNKFGFKAEKFGNRPYYFQAESRADMTSWVGALNESAEKGKDQKDAWMDVTSQNVGLPALEIRKPDCTGYLLKMARKTKRWRKRYCVLKDACIYYYKSSSSKEAEGVAHLHGYLVDSGGIPSKRFSFCLQPPEAQMRVFSFYTENDTDRSRWMEALTKSIQKWVKVDG